MSSKDLRQYPRYRVANLKEIQATMDPSFKDPKIVTLGKGGAGFYDLSLSRLYEVDRRVYTYIGMSGITEEPVEVQGRIVYREELNIEGKVVLFYGVEFIPIHRDRVAPIIDFLDELKGSGRVAVC